jgi:hypothetical protein
VGGPADVFVKELANRRRSWLIGGGRIAVTKRYRNRRRST